MHHDPDDDPAAPDRADTTGAFVARVWRADDGLRARVRTSLDLTDPDAAVVSDVRGLADEVNSEVGALLRRWLADFAGDAPVTSR